MKSVSHFFILFKVFKKILLRNEKSANFAVIIKSSIVPYKYLTLYRS
jgi:hypothetical protein